ncbi:MAG: adenosine deaminase family protein [Chloroflexi bacterium]|nr:adenosine deaminase family protein [Chloroflexota bacterium]
MRPDVFIQALPKVELHLHLEGAIPWELVRRCSDVPLPATPPWWCDGFVFDDFASDFTDAVRICYRPVLTSVERYHRSARLIFAGLADQNVRHVEISFTPRYALHQGFQLPGIVGAIKGAAPTNLSVAVFAGLARNVPEVLDDHLIQAILDTSELDGVDLYGDERKGEVFPFVDFYALARSRGLRTKAHAGELVGPQSVTDALDHLRVKRIGHGVTAARDETLMKRLVAEGVTLDMCPTSNLKLRVVESIEAHPLQLLFRQGVSVTVNTDDPAIFGCSLSSELSLLVEKLGLTLSEIAQIEEHALHAAALPAATEAAIADEIAALTTQVM